MQTAGNERSLSDAGRSVRSFSSKTRSSVRGGAAPACREFPAEGVESGGRDVNRVMERWVIVGFHEEIGENRQVPVMTDDELFNVGGVKSFT